MGKMFFMLRRGSAYLVVTQNARCVGRHKNRNRTLLCQEYLYIYLSFQFNRTDGSVAEKYRPRPHPRWRHQIDFHVTGTLGGIRRSRVNSPHKGQWGGALMIPSIYACTNDWVNKRDAGDLSRHRTYFDVTVMSKTTRIWNRFLRPKIQFHMCHSYIYISYILKTQTTWFVMEEYNTGELSNDRLVIEQNVWTWLIYVYTVRGIQRNTHMVISTWAWIFPSTIETFRHHAACSFACRHLGNRVGYI